MNQNGPRLRNPILYNRRINGGAVNDYIRDIIVYIEY